MNDSPRNTQNQPNPGAPDSRPEKGHREAPGSPAVVGETPLGPVDSKEVEATLEKAQQDLDRVVSTKLEGDDGSRHDGHTAETNADTARLSEKAPSIPVAATNCSDRSSEEFDVQESDDNTMACAEPVSTEVFHDDAEEHSTCAAPDEDDATEQHCEMTTVSTQAEDSPGRMDRLLALCAAPRNRLSPSQRKIMDIVAISLACWVPIAWGFAFFSPASREMARVEMVPGANESEAAAGAESSSAIDPGDSGNLPRDPQPNP
ncbi:MAG: hypothetical protein MK085_00030 [Phycisphaerales bacterium]|nr:hypothetical protein [Phycisphaerales bacterium]